MNCVDIFAVKGEQTLNSCVRIGAFFAEPCGVEITAFFDDDARDTYDYDHYLDQLEEKNENTVHKAIKTRRMIPGYIVPDELDLSQFGVTQIYGIHVSNFNTLYILGRHEEAYGVQIMEFLYYQSIYGGISEILSLNRMSFVSYRYNESNIILNGYNTTDADGMLSCVFVGQSGEPDRTIFVETVTLTVLEERSGFFGSFLENSIASALKNHNGSTPTYFGNYKYSMKIYGIPGFWPAPTSILRQVREDGVWVFIYKDDVEFFEAYDYDNNLVGYAAAALSPLDEQYDWYANVNGTTRLIINGVETEDYPMEYSIGYDSTTEVTTEILVNNSKQVSPIDGTVVLAKYDNILVTIDMWKTIKIIKKSTGGYFTVVRELQSEIASQKVDTYDSLYSLSPDDSLTKGQVITTDGIYILLNNVRMGPILIMNINTGDVTEIPYEDMVDQTICRGYIIRTNPNEPKLTQQKIADLF